MRAGHVDVCATAVRQGIGGGAMLRKARLQTTRSPDIGPQCPNGEHGRVEEGEVS